MSKNVIPAGRLTALRVPTTWTLLYTIPDNSTMMRPVFSFLNYSGSPLTFSMLSTKAEFKAGAIPGSFATPEHFAIPVSASQYFITDPSDFIEFNAKIGPSDVIDRERIYYGPGERIYVKASADGIVVRVSGRPNSALI